MFCIPTLTSPLTPLFICAQEPTISSYHVKMASPTPEGVHLVGSIPLKSSREVFERMVKELPGRLKRIPDGETGQRWFFVAWQGQMFPSEILAPLVPGLWDLVEKPKDEKPDPASLTLEDIKPSRYDEFAIESYKDFKELRSTGAIPKDVRFQVCFPSTVNTITMWVDPKYITVAEPLYEQRLLQSVAKTQAEIPHENLAIQIDCAVDVGFIEADRGRAELPGLKPYFSPVKEGLIARIQHLSVAVQSDVELGYHLCYGDIGHKHFIEPLDMGILVELANGIITEVSKSRPVNWVHMPVPKDRTDAEYFAPLKDLRLGETKLYLGLIHANDEEGTKHRIEAAQRAFSSGFGVATECGLGRTSPEDMSSILAIARNVTETKA